MNREAIKSLCLGDELETSKNLIELGFGELQNLSFANDFYYLPFQLLSSGFERLMKCHICLGYHEAYDKYPDSKFLKKCGGKNGHDLVSLKSFILDEYFHTHNIPLLEESLEFMTNTPELDHLIRLLSEFGKYSRYYNFDIITSSTKPAEDVEKMWRDYESEIISKKTDISRKIRTLNDVEENIDYAQREILIYLEKFVRAISLQFTLGRLGKLAMQHSSTLHPFIFLKDNEIGDRDYRGQTTRYKKAKRSPHKRTCLDSFQRRFNKHYRHTVVKKTEFSGEWPFYAEQVVIECREKHWCVVTIGDNDYALNGSAQGRYKLEDVHSAGMAILGKSVGPFIKIALEL